MDGNDNAVFFSTGTVVRINKAVVDDLKDKALASPDTTVRLCLHQSLDDAVQEMIIVHVRGTYVRPHRHDAETESFLVLEGSMLVIFFDDNGKETDRLMMGEKDSGYSFVCRITPGQYHTMIPLSETVVFLETTQGPFDRDAHNTFPSWAPGTDDILGAKQFFASIGEGDYPLRQ